MSNVVNFREQGGAADHIGGTLTVDNGGELSVASGGALTVADGAAVSLGGQGIPTNATITVGAEAADVINVGIQLLASSGVDLANRATIFAYLSADADGDALATASSGTVAIGTDGLIVAAITAKLVFMLTSEADGDIDINITHVGALTQYLVLVLPGGRRVVSGAITFA